MASGSDEKPDTGFWLARLGALPNDSPLKTVLVTLLVCLTASVVVASSAVLLRPVQLANKERERQARLADIVAALPGVEDWLKAAEGLRMEARVVDLASGRYAPGIEAEAFDPQRAAEDPAQSIAIPADRDLAQIKRRARHAVVHLVYQGDQLRLVILPVHGQGFASTLYGYLGLSADSREVVGLTFHEHSETPGLGALIDSAPWLQQWRGKRVWDSFEQPALGVADGAVDPSSPEAAYMVDGLTGATWTSRGVTNLLRFWLGDDGFGPYLRNLRRGRA